MARQKRYTVYKSGGSAVDYVYSSCITKAAREYMKRLPLTAVMKLYNKEQASITHTDNHSLLSDYVIIAE